MRYVKTWNFQTRKKSKKHKSHRNALHKVVLSMLLTLRGTYLKNGKFPNYKDLQKIRIKFFKDA